MWQTIWEIKTGRLDYGRYGKVLLKFKPYKTETKVKIEEKEK